MTSAPALSPTGRGILFYCTAGVILPVMDALSKHLTADYSAIQIAAVRFGFLLILLAPITFARNGAMARRPSARGQLLFRGILLSLSSILFVGALAHVPLATGQAIVLVFPLMVTAMSPWLLGEHVGAIRWSAVAAGFFGALMIIRPGLEPVGPGQIMALAAATTYALYSVMTRRMAAGTPRLTQLLWTVIGALVVTGAIAPFVWQPPEMQDLALMALCGLLSGAAHLLLIAAYAEAEASTVVPFSYLQIVWGVTIGYVVWGNLPGVPVWAGIALIAGSGIVVALRSRVPPQVRGAGRV